MNYEEAEWRSKLAWATATVLIVAIFFTFCGLWIHWSQEGYARYLDAFTSQEGTILCNDSEVQIIRYDK